MTLQIVEQQQKVKEWKLRLEGAEIGWLVIHEENAPASRCQVGLHLQLAPGEFPALIQGWGETPGQAVAHCITRAEDYRQQFGVSLELLKMKLTEGGDLVC